jgi:hypothetical protein
LDIFCAEIQWIDWNRYKLTFGKFLDVWVLNILLFRDVGDKN